MPRPIRIAYTIPSGAQFGAPRAGGSRTHQGCDYHCPVGTPIYGTGIGVVVARGYQPDPNSGAGNYVTVRYGDRRTTDMHLEEATSLPIGAAVGPDTVLGYVGLTGNAVNASPPGSHDHHEVYLNGTLVDPEGFYGAEVAALQSERITEQKEVPEMSRPVIVANAERPGIFHVVSIPEGWQTLDTGGLGNAELRGLTKIIEAITTGNTEARLTGQEIDATRGLLSSPLER